MLGGKAEDRVCVIRKPVAEKRLFCEAEGNEGETTAETLLPALAEGALLELVHDLRPAHQRTGEHLRKKGNVEPVTGEAVERGDAGAKIGEIHDVMESEERDAERQREARFGQVEPA